MVLPFAPVSVTAPVTLATPATMRTRSRITGLLAGTRVATADGDLPVETLLAGDLIATRDNGLVELRGTSVITAEDIDIVTIERGVFETGARGRVLQVPAAQQVLVQDWRAAVIHGRESILTPAASLVDDLLVTRRTVGSVRLYRLHFDRPQVIRAEGIDLASAREAQGAAPRRLH